MECVYWFARGPASEGGKRQFSELVIDADAASLLSLAALYCSRDAPLEGVVLPSSGDPRTREAIDAAARAFGD